MIYLKTEIEGKQINIDIYGDEFYSTCPVCGKEVNLNDEQIADSIGNFEGTQWYCRDCVEDRENGVMSKKEEII